jgi:hypothetical protein
MSDARPSSDSEICAVDIGRRIMVLRGTVLPMYVSHALSKLVVQRS